MRWWIPTTRAWRLTGLTLIKQENVCGRRNTTYPSGSPLHHNLRYSHHSRRTRHSRHSHHHTHRSLPETCEKSLFKPPHRLGPHTICAYILGSHLFCNKLFQWTMMWLSASCLPNSCCHCNLRMSGHDKAGGDDDGWWMMDDDPLQTSPTFPLTMPNCFACSKTLASWPTAPREWVACYGTKQEMLRLETQDNPPRRSMFCKSLFSWDLYHIWYTQCLCGWCLGDKSCLD